MGSVLHYLPWEFWQFSDWNVKFSFSDTVALEIKGMRLYWAASDRILEAVSWAFPQVSTTRTPEKTKENTVKPHYKSFSI